MLFTVSSLTRDAFAGAIEAVPGVGLHLGEMPDGGDRFAQEMLGRLAHPTGTRKVEGDAPAWAHTAHQTYGELPAFAGTRAMLSQLPMTTAARVFGTKVLPELARLAGSLSGFEKPEPAPQEQASRTPMEEALAALMGAANEALAPVTTAPETADEAAAASASEMGAALSEAREEGNRILCAMFGAGCDLSRGRGDQGDGSLEAELAAELARDAELCRILELAGRWRTVARRLSKSIPREGRGQVVGIETGDDLSRVVGSQLAYYVDKRLRPLFWSKYVARGLLQRRLEEPEATVAGPLCIMLDLSGSMGRAQRHVFAKAIAIASIDVAVSEGRPVYLIPFNSEVMGSFVFEGQDPRGSIGFAKVRPSGGTNFGAPWWEFARLCEEASPWAHGDQADVVMITDGRANCDRARAVKDSLRERYPGLTCYAFCFGAASADAMMGLVDHSQSVEEIADSALSAMTMVVSAAR
jgi:uncharacterized protein with von Willebrand factor type A (vWA) domain